MSTIDDIISTINLNAAQFAKSIGVHPTQIYDLQSGKTKSISPAMADKILAKYPQFSKLWLLTGEGEMINDTPTETEDCEAETLIDETYVVPLVPIGVFAGSLTGFDIEQVDARNCEMVVCPIPKMDWALEVVGDSMEPEYPNGSRVFVKKVNSAIFLEWGCVYVIDTENGLVMKTIQPSRDREYITCESLNPRYAPFDIPKESIRAMYRVRACLTLK